VRMNLSVTGNTKPPVSAPCPLPSVYAAAAGGPHIQSVALPLLLWLYPAAPALRLASSTHSSIQPAKERPIRDYGYPVQECYPDGFSLGGYVMVPA
ncbi:unnamed protein product, partial [Closterium sp. Naga37s-1]